MNLRTVLRTAAMALALLMLGGWAHAAGPTRVARLGYLEGEVSFLEAGDADWVQAALNRPLTTGDRLWTDRSAVAELQLEGVAVRVGERSNLTVLNLDTRITQLQLSQGAVRLRVRALASGQSIEVDTPNLALVLRRTGDYRIEVDPQGDATLVLVQNGSAEVFGDGASYRVDNGRTYRFYGTGLSDYEDVADYRADELDRWAQERERRIDNSASARYVPAGVVGFEDLDANGRWVVDASYGNVWLPSRVAAGWTPYRDGRWTWVEPWGWTWIDDAPWGYAVSHYGRWAYLGNAWGWVPGAARERVVYAPALVVFVGGNRVRSAPDRRNGFGGTSWFPLGPREDFRPGQAPSRDGYANQRVRGAVVVPTNQPPRERAPDAEARSRPPRDNHPVVARTAPPVPVAPQTPAGNGAPVRSGSQAEPPVRVRVVTPPAAAAPLVVLPPVGRSDAPRPERRPEPARPAANAPPIAAPVRIEPARGDQARGDASRGDAARNDGARNEAAKSDAEKSDAARNEAAKNEAARNEAAKNEAIKSDPARNDAAKAAATRAEAGRLEAGRAEAAKADAARNAAAQAEVGRAEAAKAEAARRDATRVEEAKGNAAKAEASRNEAARAEANRAEAGRADAARADAARNAAAQAAAAKARAAQEQAARAAEAIRNTAVRAEAGRAEAARADAARVDAARAEAGKAEAARAEQSRAEQARQPGRNADGPRGNGQRPNRELTPEEELLRQGKRKP